MGSLTTPGCVNRHTQPASMKPVIGLSSSAADGDACVCTCWWWRTGGGCCGLCQPAAGAAAQPRPTGCITHQPLLGQRRSRTTQLCTGACCAGVSGMHPAGAAECVHCYNLPAQQHIQQCLSCRVSHCCCRCCRCCQVLDSLKALKELPYTPAPQPASGPEASVAAGVGGCKGSSGAAADRPAAAGGGSGAGGEEGSMQRVDSAASAGVTDTSGPLASLDSPSAAAAAAATTT